ncbi:hypothetical protein D3C71_1959910 [compost metagenome]
MRSEQWNTTSQKDRNYRWFNRIYKITREKLGQEIPSAIEPDISTTLRTKLANSRFKPLAHDLNIRVIFLPK